MKRRFDFRLERVRRVRDLEERVARAERASAEELARAAEASRDRARATLERSRAELAELLSGTLEPRGVLSAQRALDSELVRLRRAVESARTARMQAERSASAHRERQKAARALAELRERARLRHALELDKEENAQLDEVAQGLGEAERRAERRRSPAGEDDSSPGPVAADRGAGSSSRPAS
ncbi:MAG: hypothetical protein EXS08_11370 [Planctomycetes bacterium]|nr:hypothetical protein [Planctomycetota bacterium]